MSKSRESQFEAKLKRLQEIVEALESPELSLEDGMALYKEGAQCSRFCREKLEKARHELEVWQDGEAKACSAEDLAKMDAQKGEEHD